MITEKKSSLFFSSPFLERLTRTHIAIPITLFLMYGLALLYWNITSVRLAPLLTIGLFLAGLLLFTLVEYAMHRFLFHMNTPTEIRQSIQYKIHGVHHDYPKEKDRLAMPPILSLAIATFLLWGFELIIGDYVFAFLPGFLFGYAGYLFTHYLVHIHKVPKNAFKVLWKHHAIHHHKSHGAFGVSSPLWDFVFKTMP